MRFMYTDKFVFLLSCLAAKIVRLNKRLSGFYKGPRYLHSH